MLEPGLTPVSEPEPECIAVPVPVPQRQKVAFPAPVHCWTGGVRYRYDGMVKKISLYCPLKCKNTIFFYCETYFLLRNILFITNRGELLQVLISRGGEFLSPVLVQLVSGRLQFFIPNMSMFLK
jgi:hypothetical protein